MFRIGQGYDAHRFIEARKLILGGVEIPYLKGMDAHSDGDVVIHAVCDALLGAAALGDIGQHFPDSSAQFKSIDSRILLRRVKELIQAQGFNIVNLDATVLAEKPKLAHYIDSMRECLATDLEISKDQVSIKATTTEKMGFIGREEGIAVHAVVLIARHLGVAEKFA